jgi:hypothetical protein
MLDLFEHFEAVHLSLSYHDASISGEALAPFQSGRGRLTRLRPRGRLARYDQIGQAIHTGGHDMKDTPIPALDLEVEEIESRERGGGCSTSSSTSRLCTCACRFTTEVFPAKR